MKSLITLASLATLIASSAHAITGSETGNSVSTHAPQADVVQCIDFDAIDADHSIHLAYVSTPDGGKTYFLNYENAQTGEIPPAISVTRVVSPLVGAPILYQGTNESLRVNYTTAPMQDNMHIGLLSLADGSAFQMRCK